MRKGIHSKVIETQGSLTFGHSNWTISSLLSWFCSKNFKPFFPAPHNKPFHITPQRGGKEGSGAENGEKGNHPKVNETHGFLTQRHSNWTIYSLLSWFHCKQFPPFYPAPHNKPFLLFLREEGGKGRGLKIGKRESSKGELLIRERPVVTLFERPVSRE